MRFYNFFKLAEMFCQTIFTHTMKKPIIYWIRRDFRIHNNPALKFAVESKQPVIPVFIKDEFVDNLGSAPKWRLGLGLEYLSAKYKKYGVEYCIHRKNEYSQQGNPKSTNRKSARTKTKMK